MKTIYIDLKPYTFPLSQCFSTLKNLHYRIVQYDENEYITLQGIRNENLVITLDGKYRIIGYDEDGKTSSLVINSGFNMLGDLEFTIPSFSPMNVQAISNVKAILIPIKENRIVLENDTVFLMKVNTQLAQKLINSTFSTMENRHGLYERFINYLYIQEDEYLTYSLQDIASILNTSYRQLLRVVDRCVKEGKLEKIKKGKYKIKEEN